jgi:hypothetical protein
MSISIVTRVKKTFFVDTSLPSAREAVAQISRLGSFGQGNAKAGDVIIGAGLEVRSGGCSESK